LRCRIRVLLEVFPQVDLIQGKSGTIEMMKRILKVLFTLVFVALMSVAALAQSNNDQKKPPPPKKEQRPNPPKIVIKEKERPKDDKQKPKKPEFESNFDSPFFRED
jgi:preprotein translocase subunit SecG